ncbi:uncharacterized protein LOC110466649 [Mizuhopecten yessoensis]|uniref:Uncharacterized protein n=1 Tax=Mizuhopecten yessoensis TaxID=6573 RepID=A0A210PNW9_MIZYE|nr:uncharacterized protein LOC110466649 [Mizuhopecten yessoensis]OWF38136.1 hypothetical protein KP79_PYT08835 [Mizuhopecten yessoensis]
MEGSVDMSGSDKYTASIEFSNACREFYIKRVKATENLKDQIRIKSDIETKQRMPKSQQPASSIESAMDKLRREMASLMDQDLSLMKQLLTLNETIEDIKSRRLYGVSKESLCQSNGDLGGSRDSFSDMDLYDSDEELHKQSNMKYTCLNVKDNFSRQTNLSSKAHRTESLRKNDSSSSDTQNSLPDMKKPQIIHGAQRSIDSGYDESDCYQTDIEVTI